MRNVLAFYLLAAVFSAHAAPITLDAKTCQPEQGWQAKLPPVRSMESLKQVYWNPATAQLSIELADDEAFQRARLARIEDEGERAAAMQQVQDAVETCKKLHGGSIVVEVDKP